MVVCGLEIQDSVELGLGLEVEAALALAGPGGPLRPAAPVSSVSGFLGRRSECATLDQVVARVRGGHSQALVLRGEAGGGKSALLGYLVERSSGCNVARVTGVESETELAFAGLHQLCAPFLGRLERLPGPQREALLNALGLRDAGAPDRFLVGLAVLGLLSAAAEERPMVCAVDDAHWLDEGSAQALAFAAHHLVAEPIAIVFAVREPYEGLTDLPEMAIGGLADGDARALLNAVVPGPLDEAVRDRLVAETRGNPKALLDLTRGLAPGDLAGGFGLLDCPALAGRLEARFQRRLLALPPPTRLLLVVAAAQPVLDPVLVWKAAALLGIETEAATPAAAAGLVEPGGQLRFRHPLARFAVYRSASPQERQAAHRALAEATSPGVDPDRRAWHRGHAAPGLDEDAAAELERSVDQAEARAGLAAAAAFRQLAAELTPGAERLGERALAAAEAKQRVGACDVATRLLAMVRGGALDELQRARAELLRGQVAADTGRVGDAPALLLDAARRLEPLDDRLSRKGYRDALTAALGAGRLIERTALLEITESARSAVAGAQPAGTADRLLDGLALLVAGGHAAGAPPLRLALGEFAEAEMPVHERVDWLPLACMSAQAVWDDEAWFQLSTELIELAQRSGALAVLPHALLSAVALHAAAGDLARARSTADRAQEIAAATGRPLASYGPLTVAAWSGQAGEVERLVAASRDDIAVRCEGQWLTACDWATAVLCNGLGRYQEACAAAERACRQQANLGWSAWSLAELVEASVRTGTPERATAAVSDLSRVALATGSDWVLGMAARSRALLTAGDAADRLYGEAIERLSGTRVRAELARSHLLYGEWLRRENRRSDARQHLQAAHEMLETMGFAGFAERARTELLATAATLRKRTPETRDELTPQESHIAGLARDGLTNPQIGAQLYLSSRTVEWHLRKVFNKLGIASRKDLRDALPPDVRAPLAA